MSFNKRIKLSSTKISSKYIKYLSILIKVQSWNFYWKWTYLYNFNKCFSPGYQNRETALAQITEIQHSCGGNGITQLPVAHHMVNEGGISRATLLHLSFHNKWLSLGKPKQVTPTMGAAQDAPELWFGTAVRALPTRSSPCSSRERDTTTPAHTRPQELIRLTNNPAKPSQANQTLCGQASILSAAVWCSRGHQHTRASARRAQRARAPRFCSEQPQISVLSQPSHQEQNTTEQCRDAAAAVRGCAGTDPSPAQPGSACKPRCSGSGDQPVTAETWSRRKPWGPNFVQLKPI